MFDLSQATVENRLLQGPTRSKVTMHCTDLKVVEYATDTERVIKPTMKGVPSNS